MTVSKFATLGCAAFGAAATFALAVAAPAFAAADLLGNFEAWDAYKGQEPKGPVCYVVAEPMSKEPASARRDPVFLVINTWPTQKVRQQPNIQIGYPFKEGSVVNVQVGSDKFEFFTQGESAWLKEAADEARFVEALRRGAEVQVQGISRRGTLTTDIYPLKGISAALDKADEACK